MYSYYKQFLLILLLSLALIACGGEVEPAAVEGSGAVSAETASTTPERTRLTQDHTDAASIQTQLAVGTLSLEETDYAVDEALASEILPLWQALQALGQSESTASAELDPVINQIQDSMSAEQISQISEMQLTDENIQTMLADGVIALGRGAGGPGGGAGGPGGNGGAAGGPGGPGGGGRGGGLPGGGGGGQGGPGGLGANLSEEEIAEQRAERFGEAGAGDFLSNAMTGSVVRLLSVKTGEQVEQQRPPQDETVQPLILATVATALDISEDDLTAQLEAGASYAELIAEAGIDTAALRAALETALAETQLAERGLDNTINRILGEGGE